MSSAASDVYKRQPFPWGLLFDQGRCQRRCQYDDTRTPGQLDDTRAPDQSLFVVVRTTSVLRRRQGSPHAVPVLHRSQRTPLPAWQLSWAPENHLASQASDRAFYVRIKSSSPWPGAPILLPARRGRLGGTFNPPAAHGSFFPPILSSEQEGSRRLADFWPA